MSRVWLAALATALLLIACGRQSPRTDALTLDRAAESYVRLVLALGERDADSLDTYHGPPLWQEETRARRATLADIQESAHSLVASLTAASGHEDDDQARRLFLIRQLGAIVARIDILRGARPLFADEVRALFGLHVPALDEAAASTRAALDRLLPGSGDLAFRYEAFDRNFLIAPERLDRVLSRAIAGCRAVTLKHASLPPAERVEVEYVRDLPWSAFTRYEGGFKSRIRVNTGLPITVDRALDLACHEAYPGHHTIDTLLEARFGTSRVEFLVRPLFSPQSLLHEAASSLGGGMVFSEPARIAFERDELFPLAGLNAAEVERHVRVGRLLDGLHGVEASIASRYLDGALDFPRASAALEHDAMMPSPDATLKFLNQFRTYVATYTIGRDLVSRYIDARARAGGDANDRWRAYIELVTSPAQVAPIEPPRR